MHAVVRILNVEDDARDSEIIQHRLHEAGLNCELLRVDTEERFVRALEDDAYDVIVADYDLPRFGGARALELAQKLRPDLPLIFFSGTLGEETALETLRRGATDYVLKQRPARLVAAVQRALRQADESRRRRAAEAALRLKDVAIASSLTGFAMADLDGRLTYVNAAALSLWGFQSPEEVLGRQAVDFWQQDEETSAVLRRLRTNGHLICELTSLRRDGSGGTVQVVASVVRNEKQEPVCVMAWFFDTTERHEAEEALRRSEELHRSIFDSSPNLIFTVDLEGRLLSANHAFLRKNGLTAVDAHGKTLAELGIAQGNSADLDAQILEVVATRAPVGRQGSVVMRDGTRLVLEKFAGPMFDDSDAVSAISVIACDVTDRVRAAESLVRLSHAVDNAAEVIFMTDRQGMITSVNPAFERVYGYSREEAIGKTPRILKSGRLSSQTYTTFWRAILEGRNVVGEFTNRARDGREVTVSASVSPVLDASGQIDGFIALQTDITDRKRSEQEQAALQMRLFELGKLEAIGTLAGGIAHDFNNILSIVLSFSFVAEKSRDQPERFAQAMETIRQAVRRGSDLARQVLTFARKREPNAEKVDVNALCAEVVNMIRVTFPKTISFEYLPSPALPSVAADASQLHEVLLNLCLNARDAMPAGGTVTIETKVASPTEARTKFPDAPDRPFVCIRLTDTGQGMSRESQSRVFEPFFTTKKEKGTGLGLAVAYGVVKAHEGFIGVDSSEGVGTTFEVFLPYTESTSTQPAVERLRNRTTGNETILLVEDEPDLGPLFASTLQTNGYDVMLARDGGEALRLFAQHADHVQLVVCDNDLPGILGSDLFYRLRVRKPALPVVLMSGFLEPEILSRLRRDGLASFLEKPYDEQQLLNTVRAALDRSS